MCIATDNKSFGLGLTAINEVYKRIVYMTYEMFLSYSNGYTIQCMMFTVWLKWIAALMPNTLI